MKGRKPTPSNIRLLHGNPARRPMPKDEPKLKSKVLAAPPGLPKDVHLVWRRIARWLAAAGVSTELDSLALRLLCESWVTYEEACEKVRKAGLVNAQFDGQGRVIGVPYPNPYLAVRNRAQDHVMKLFAEFGMTPSSRTRVKTVEGKTGGGHAKDLFGF